MPRQRKKEESERLRGKRDQIKFIDFRFERGQVVGALTCILCGPKHAGILLVC